METMKWSNVQDPNSWDIEETHWWSAFPRTDGFDIVLGDGAKEALWRGEPFDVDEMKRLMHKSINEWVNGLPAMYQKDADDRFLRRLAQSGVRKNEGPY